LDVWSSIVYEGMLNVIIINLLITVSYLNSQTNYNDIDDDDDDNNGNTNITRLARWHYW